MDVVGLVATILALGSPAYIVGKVTEARLKRRKMELDAQKGDPKEVEALKTERKMLVERIENLETIVCSVDHDLNQKLVKLIDEQRLLEPPKDATPALEKTMTAPLLKQRSAGEL